MTTAQQHPQVATTGARAAQPFGAMPDTREVNFFASDPYLGFVLRRRLAPEELALAEPRLLALGARLGNEIEDLAAEADRQTPVLRVRDKRGERVDEIVPSRAYRELERILYGELGLAALALRPGVLEQERPSSLLLNDAFVYLAAQVESGLFCPLGMTRALARTLLKFAPHDIIADYVPRLTATDLARLYTGAMFMTEKQGGSDLGATATSARPADDRPGWWLLSGEKWFCSNVSADVILTLARPEGAPDGTRGLGLFVVPRVLPDGSRNGYRIERVKEKLGMRSFASGEVTFASTYARMLGGPGEGWHQMTEMLNVTRLGCASAAAALARRSLLEALVHARGRVAFGHPLADLPLMREQLLDMLLDVEAFTALYFEGAAQLQAADAGDEHAGRLARVLTPLAKYHVSEEARRVVAEGMEVRGGNAYIEDWPNARLLRDVHVQAIWEGTGNISALDVVRAVLRDDAGTLLLETLRGRMRAIAHADVGRAARLSLRALDGVEATLATLTTLPAPERDLLTKRFTRRLAHVVSATLLVEDAAFQAEREGSSRCLVQAARYLRRYVFPPVGGPAFELDRLPLEHFDALVDWSPAIPAAASHALLVAMEGGEHA